LEKRAEEKKGRKNKKQAAKTKEKGERMRKKKKDVIAQRALKTRGAPDCRRDRGEQQKRLRGAVEESSSE